MVTPGRLAGRVVVLATTAPVTHRTAEENLGLGYLAATLRPTLADVEPSPTPTVSTPTSSSASLRMALPYVGRHVIVKIDRPYGSAHTVHGFRYEANYGHIPGALAPDGDELDAYLLGPTQPLDRGDGTCVGIIHRLNDDDDKLVVIPTGYDLTDDQILSAVAFQERPGCHELLRPFCRTLQRAQDSTTATPAPA